ncbi:MAG: ABC transporter substrate-binding protein [Lachnospiraceae bacterium]|jgi:iron complex transport system substrate-binding protein|nr:ABC transporter substrate-binding protein [Lachnospiraceae bacterium]
MKRIVSFLLSIVMVATLLTGCGGGGSKAGSSDKDIAGLKYTDSVEFKYAKMVTIDNYEGGYRLIRTQEKDNLLVVPEGKEAPKDLPKDIKVLKAPADKIYLAASAAMALVNAVDGVDNILLSGINPDDWYITKASENMKAGKMLFAGKYSAPDYELMLSKGCQLAIESTMIYHTPEVREKLEELGIPVFVDLASREGDPLGRMEWVKVYGAMIGNLDKANTFFNEKAAEVEKVKGKEKTGKTVAFVSINSSGLAVVRKSKDYVPAMIEIAGGKYIFENLGDGTDALSTMNMTLEEFYNGAMDADIIIYNSTIAGEVNSIQDLIGKAHIFADLKAVKEGNVWCTFKNMYQATDSIADIIVDMRAIFANDEEGIKNLKYIYKLN